MFVFAGTVAQATLPGTHAMGEDLLRTLGEQPEAPMVVARVENTDKTRVNLIRRTVPRNAIVHETGWEVHHIVGGSGTVVTGGRLMRSVGADGVRAATIQGGESRRVVVGDVLIIPAGTPHWYSQIPESVTYLEIRYDPGDE
jgi:mannose-6-phosphate isomerase-like protein (cupin superfamily)